ncbi:MAG: hypothetical protein GY696_32665, partial [Gammaproteobacteria bacterium]|nr:hypothetical protein [Gammaproteobacteria bacterium]
MERIRAGELAIDPHTLATVANGDKGTPAPGGNQSNQLSPTSLPGGLRWERCPRTHPHQHHQGELARTYVGFQPLPGADSQPRAAQKQEEEVPEDPEPEEPLRAEGPPQEEKTQLPQPQISTLGCPTGLGFTHKVKSTIPVSMRPRHNERRLSPFRMGNSPPHSAQESGLGSLEELSLGAELVGLGLPG